MLDPFVQRHQLSVDRLEGNSQARETRQNWLFERQSCPLFARIRIAIDPFRAKYSAGKLPLLLKLFKCIMRNITPFPPPTIDLGKTQGGLVAVFWSGILHE